MMILGASLSCQVKFNFKHMLGHYLNNLNGVVEPFVLLMFKLFLNVIKNTWTTETVVRLQLCSNKKSYVSAGPQRGHNFLFYLKRNLQQCLHAFRNRRISWNEQKLKTMIERCNHHSNSVTLLCSFASSASSKTRAR